MSCMMLARQGQEHHQLTGQSHMSATSPLSWGRTATPMPSSAPLPGHSSPRTLVIKKWNSRAMACRDPHWWCSPMLRESVRTSDLFAGGSAWRWSSNGGEVGCGGTCLRAPPPYRVGRHQSDRMSWKVQRASAERSSPHPDGNWGALQPGHWTGCTWLLVSHLKRRQSVADRGQSRARDG